MFFKIDSTITQQFPGVEIGLIVVRQVRNTGQLPTLVQVLRTQAEQLRQSLTLETITAHPHIAVWRSAYKAFGAKPKEHRSSIESLCRLVLGGKELRSINPLVDMYNLISLKYLLPLGGEDLAMIEGDVILARAGDNEPPVLLLGDKEPHPPHAGEVIYKDNRSAICRRWNWREADRTKLSEITTDCILVIEALPPIAAETVDQAAQELCDLIKSHCGGSVSYHRLNQNQPAVEIATA